MAFLDRLQRPVRGADDEPDERARRAGREGAGGPRLGGGARAGRRPDRGDGSVPARGGRRRARLPARRRPGASGRSSARWPTYACWSWGRTPTPTPTHPIGLSFAVERHVWPLPPSLLNIYVELRDDLGIVPPRHGDLSAWADQGVMLLNRHADGAAGRLQQPPGQGLGGDHRAGHHRARRARRAVRRDPVGPARAVAQAAARRGAVRWSRPTPPRSAPGAGSSGPSPSAGSTGCSRSRARSRSTGPCRRTTTSPAR